MRSVLAWSSLVSRCFMQITPLIFEPYFRPQIWGGRNLERLLGKNLPPDGAFGESWEISAHDHHVSRVAEGPFRGRTLTELCTNYPKALFGIYKPADGRFPLLIKFLDCQDLLSIQVHPDDALARELLGEERGKSEAWVVLHAERTGRIYAGLKAGIQQQDIRQGLRDGSLEECLHKLTPKPGDCIFLPAGTVHAAGGGVVMAEIQQSSDATFRLYDWNRLDKDGNPRTLHIEQAMKAIHFWQGPIPLSVAQTLDEPALGGQGERLVQCQYFFLDRIGLRKPIHLCKSDNFGIWMVMSGSVSLRSQGYERKLIMGDTVLVPASAGPLGWEPADVSNGACLLRITPAS